MNWSPSGDVYLIYHYGHFGFPIGPDSGLGTLYAFLTGGAWTVDVFLTQFLAGYSSSQALLDPDGSTLHFIFWDAAFPLPSNGHYLRVAAGGAITQSDVFPAHDNLGSGGWCGHCLINGNEILIATDEPINPGVNLTRRPSVWVGTPLAAPVWALENIDPDPMVIAPALFLGLGAAPAPLPSTLAVNKVTVPGADPGLFNLQIDAVTQAANQGNGGTTGPVVVVAGLHQVGETAGIGTNLADYATTYGGDAAPDGSIVLAPGDNKVAIITNTRNPIPPAVVVQVTQGGSRRVHVLVPNKFDQCLSRELCAHLLYRPSKACCEPILYRDINLVRAPQDYIPFRKTSAIPTPLAVSGDVEVLNFQVPHGYDGVIAGLFNVYTGPGFQDGNGDIEWRVIINRVYATHLGRVLVTLGSRQSSYPVDGGIEVKSGNYIRYIVNVPNLSGGILPLNSQIVCGLEGLFYVRA
jgi:hypothetical protein